VKIPQQSRMLSLFLSLRRRLLNLISSFASLGPPRNRLLFIFLLQSHQSCVGGSDLGMSKPIKYQSGRKTLLTCIYSSRKLFDHRFFAGEQNRRWHFFYHWAAAVTHAVPHTPAKAAEFSNINAGLWPVFLITLSKFMGIDTCIS
jgi:hypothetical protein